MVLYAVFTAITGDTFNTVNNQITIMRAAAVFLILGVGQTFAMTTGGIDISTGSMIGVVGAIVGSGLELGWMDPIYAIPSAILVGAVLGAFNGFNITVLGVPPLLATLGTFVAYRGFTQYYMGVNLVTGSAGRGRGGGTGDRVRPAGLRHRRSRDRGARVVRPQPHALWPLHHGDRVESELPPRRRAST